MSRRKESWNKDETGPCPDVRLSDFANAALASKWNGRVSKTITGKDGRAGLLRQLKHWWEFEEGDLEDQLQESDVEEDEQTPAQDVEQSKTSPKKSRRRRKIQTSGGDGVSAKDYPVDLWFLIASYIPPEDVWRFASFAPPTARIVRSVGFWKQLYKRYYSPWQDMPDCLRPEAAVTRLYGVRTRVIQSLFHMYPPFKLRCRTQEGVELRGEAMTKLSRGVCRSVWQEQSDGGGKRVWCFFWKFQCQRRVSDSLPKRSRDPLHFLDNIWANREDGCCVLKVCCSQFTHIPPTVLGWRVSEIGFPLAPDLRSHRLRLSFRSTQSQQPSVIVLDGLQSVALLDWWHPQYPLALL